MAGLSGLLCHSTPRAGTLLILFSVPVFAVAVRKTGVAELATTLALLILTNLAFWASVTSWKLLPVSGEAAPIGLDPFAGTLAVWCVVLCCFSIYEAGVIVWQSVAKRQPRLLVWLLLVLLPLFGTVRYAYVLVQGA
jgi:hypothetical protein